MFLDLSVAFVYVRPVKVVPLRIVETVFVYFSSIKMALTGEETDDLLLECHGLLTEMRKETLHEFCDK